MKYNININQLVLSETNLDLIDCAILDYLIYICISQNDKVSKERRGEYTWVNYKHLLEEMPLLRIKSIGALTPRIKKIESEEFIKTLLDYDNRLFVKLNKKIDNLFTNVNRPIHDDEEGYSYKRTYNNTIDNNITISKDIVRKPSSYGNKDINDLIDLLKEKNNGVLDGTIQSNRRYCYNLLNKFGYKKDKEKAINTIKYIIDVGSKSKFHSANITNFKYLYYNGLKIIGEIKNKGSGIIIS